MYKGCNTLCTWNIHPFLHSSIFQSIRLLTYLSIPLFTYLFPCFRIQVSSVFPFKIGTNFIFRCISFLAVLFIFFNRSVINLQVIFTHKQESGHVMWTWTLCCVNLSRVKGLEPCTLAKFERPKTELRYYTTLSTLVLWNSKKRHSKARHEHGKPRFVIFAIVFA